MIRAIQDTTVEQIKLYGVVVKKEQVKNSDDKPTIVDRAVNDKSVRLLVRLLEKDGSETRVVTKLIGVAKTTGKASRPADGDPIDPTPVAAGGDYELGQFKFEIVKPAAGASGFDFSTFTNAVDFIVQLVEQKNGDPLAESIESEPTEFDELADREANRVLNESVVYFNLHADEQDNDVKDQIVRLEHPSLYYSPTRTAAQLPPPVTFHELALGFQLQKHDADTLGEGLRDLGELERERLLKFIAGDVSTDHDTPELRPRVKNPKLPPKPDDQEFVTYPEQSEFTKYEQIIDQRVERYSGPVTRFIRARQIAARVGEKLKELKGFWVDIPVGNEMLRLYLNNPGNDSSDNPVPANPDVKKPDERIVDSYVQQLFSLVPDVADDSTTDEMIVMALGAPFEKSKKQMLRSVKDRVILQRTKKASPADTDTEWGDPWVPDNATPAQLAAGKLARLRSIDVITLWMAEFRAEADEELPWFVNRRDLSQEEIEVLAVWLASDVRTLKFWGAIPVLLNKRSRNTVAVATYQTAQELLQWRSLLFRINPLKAVAAPAGNLSYLAKGLRELDPVAEPEDSIFRLRKFSDNRLRNDITAIVNAEFTRAHFVTDQNPNPPIPNQLTAEQQEAIANAIREHIKKWPEEIRDDRGDLGNAITKLLAHIRHYVSYAPYEAGPPAHPLYELSRVCLYDKPTTDKLALLLRSPELAKQIFEEREKIRPEVQRLESEIGEAEARGEDTAALEQAFKEVSAKLQKLKRKAALFHGIFETNLRLTKAPSESLEGKLEAAKALIEKELTTQDNPPDQREDELERWKEKLTPLLEAASTTEERIVRIGVEKEVVQLEGNFFESDEAPFQSRQTVEKCVQLEAKLQALIVEEEKVKAAEDALTGGEGNDELRTALENAKKARDVVANEASQLRKDVRNLIAAAIPSANPTLLRDVSDCLLFDALEEVADEPVTLTTIEGVPTTFEAPSRQWQQWPVEVRARKRTADKSRKESIQLFFDHVRRQHPSPATALVAFFNNNPRWNLPFFDLEAAAEAEIAAEDDTEVIKATTKPYRSTHGDSGIQAIKAEVAVATRHHINNSALVYAKLVLLSDLRGLLLGCPELDQIRAMERILEWQTEELQTEDLQSEDQETDDPLDSLIPRLNPNQEIDLGSWDRDNEGLVAWRNKIKSAVASDQIKQNLLERANTEDEEESEDDGAEPENGEAEKGEAENTEIELSPGVLCCLFKAWDRAGGTPNNDEERTQLESFCPSDGTPALVAVNANDQLVDCRPPAFLSKISSGAYLKYLFNKVHFECPDDGDAESSSGSEDDSEYGSQTYGCSTNQVGETPANDTNDSESDCEDCLLLENNNPVSRPDIKKLLINKSNSETLIPEIDLVNELLERTIAGQLDDQGENEYQTPDSPDLHELRDGKECLSPGAVAITGTVSNNQSPRSEEELATLPEFSSPGRESLCRDELAERQYPSMLPYDSRLDLVRTTLDELGTSRYELQRTFRKNISFHRNPALQRAPEIAALAWEKLGFSKQEVALLNLQEPSEELAAYLEINEALSASGKFQQLLEILEITEEEYSALVTYKPWWIDLPAIANGSACEPQVLASIPTSQNVFLTYKHLRIWRKLRDEIVSRPTGDRSIQDQLCVVKKLVEGVGYYDLDVNGDKQEHLEFVEELAAFKSLCDDAKVHYLSDESLVFLHANANEQQAQLAKWFPLKSGMCDSGENWETLQKLCGIKIVHFDATGTDPRKMKNRERLRRNLRLAELATKVRQSCANVPELHFLFWNYDDCLDPKAKFATDSLGGFDDLNARHREKNQWKPIEEEEQFKSEQDARKAVKSLLCRLGFPTDPNLQIDVGTTPKDCVAAGANITTSADEICQKLYRVLSSERLDWVPYSIPNGVPKKLANCCRNGMPKPFCVDQQTGTTLCVCRSVTERELIQAFQWVESIGNCDAKTKLQLKNSMALLAELPRYELRSLIPLLPNQREAAQKLIGPDQPPIPNFPVPLVSNERKWSYVYRQLDQMMDSLVDHFSEGIFGNELATTDRELVESLLFDQHLRARSRDIESIFLDDHSHHKDELKEGVIVLPNRPWRDLILFRGSGFAASYSEHGLDFWSARRDGDMNFMVPRHEMNSEQFLGWPEGWGYETPLPTQIPLNRCIPDSLGRGWTADWKGLLYFPENVSEKDGKEKDKQTKHLFIAVNVAPLCVGNDNAASVALRVNGQIIDRKWKAEQWTNGYVDCWCECKGTETTNIMVFGPIPHSAELQNSPRGCGGDEVHPDSPFLNVEVRLDDRALEHGQAQVSLCFAIEAGECPPPALKFKPVDSSRVFYSPRLIPTFAPNEPNPVAASVDVEHYQLKGWGYFHCMYDLVWKAAKYSSGLKLGKDELELFADPHFASAFAGYDPNFPALGSNDRELPFDLDNLSHGQSFDPPADIGNYDPRRALFDQWERLEDYKDFRDSLPKDFCGISSRKRLRKAFELSRASGDLDFPAVSAIGEALGIKPRDFRSLNLLFDSFKFVNSDRSEFHIKRQHLKNHEWLSRARNAFQYLGRINHRLAASTDNQRLWPAFDSKIPLDWSSEEIEEHCHTQFRKLVGDHNSEIWGTEFKVSLDGKIIHGQGFSDIGSKAWLVRTGKNCTQIHELSIQGDAWSSPANAADVATRKYKDEKGTFGHPPCKDEPVLVVTKKEVEGKERYYIQQFKLADTPSIATLPAVEPIARSSDDKDSRLCFTAEISNQIRPRHRDVMIEYWRTSDLANTLQCEEAIQRLGEKLLVDVDCEPSRKITRVQSSISSNQRLLTRFKLRNLENAEFMDFKTWVQHVWQHELYPENLVGVRQDSEKSVAYKQLEECLRKNEISLIAGPGAKSCLSSDSNDESALAKCPRPDEAGTNQDKTKSQLKFLREMEELEHIGSVETELLDRAISRREPHFGWLTKRGATDISDNKLSEGWEPGPTDLKAAFLLTVEGNNECDPITARTPNKKRHFLFWPVPTLAHVDNSKEKSYGKPAIDGSPEATIKRVPSIRLGWSWKYHEESYWQPSQISDEWRPVADIENVNLSAAAGEQILVSCGGAEGFSMPDPALSTGLTLHLDFSDKDEKAAPTRYRPSASYGGLQNLPPGIFCDCKELVCETIAPSLTAQSQRPNEATEEIPAFQFTALEKRQLAPLAISQKLASVGEHKLANRWMAQVIPVEKPDLSWCKSEGDETLGQKRSRVLLYLNSIRQQADDLFAQVDQANSRQAIEHVRKLQKLLGNRPKRIDLPADVAKPLLIADLQFKPPGVNPNLTAIWDWVEITLQKLRHEKELNGVSNPTVHSDFFDPPSAIKHWDVPRSPYRFSFLIQKAIETANDVKSFGQQLLSAIEKGDAEHLSQLRTSSEKQIAWLTRNSDEVAWQAAENQWRVLKQNRWNTEFRMKYYMELIAGRLISGERSHLSLLRKAEIKTFAAQLLEAVGQAVAIGPDVFVGMLSFSEVPSAEKFSQVANFAAKVLHTIASLLQSEASRDLTNAGYDRREREWKHQRDTAKHEMTWLERQIDGQFLQMDMAEKKLNIQQQQLEFSRRTFVFLRGKFSNTDLYDWMQRELMVMYHQALGVAIEYAKQAENTLLMERHTSVPSFVSEIVKRPASMREALLFGDQVHSSLRRMEKFYYDDNVRENELTKHYSLRLHSPHSLISLRSMGVCEFEIPEWSFDLEHPGHFMRRIKSVSLSLPCMLGPYQTVNARLVNVSSKVRISEDHGQGYEERHSSACDQRFYRSEGIHEAISTTGAQNDDGMFEMSFKDERLLPFEGSGAVSRWRIELPHDSNWFDISTLTDAVLHISYTAKQGSQSLREAAMLEARKNLPSKDNPKTRIVDLRHDLPHEWEKYIGEEHCQSDGKSEGDASTICLCLDRNRFFPWSKEETDIRIRNIDLIVQSQTGEGVSFEKVTYSIDNQQLESTLVENCIAENTYVAELDPGIDSPLAPWKVSIPRSSSVGSIYFLVHYYFGDGDQGSTSWKQLDKHSYV